jgi:hypothetical protein
MMRGRKSSYAERLDMAQRALTTATDAEVGEELGWSQWTVRKWRRAFVANGTAALVSQMGASQVGSLGRFPAVVRTTIDRMRRQNPGWGPKTILSELHKDPVCADLRLPSRASIAAYIKAYHTPRRYQRHTELAQPRPVRSTQPHEEWELDAQGALRLPGLGSVCVINILDTLSRVIAVSLAVGPTRAPQTADYQLACRLAFTEFGLPQRITLDHDTCFIESTAPSPFPRRFHLWLVALGIAARFIERPPPQEHSQIERAHLTMMHQALLGELPPTWNALNQHLDARRSFYNQDYPSAALGNRAPLQAYPQARHSGRFYAPHREADLLDLQRVANYLVPHTWYRPVSDSGQVWIHDARYNLGRQWTNHTLTIRFDAQTWTFCFYAEDSALVAQLPAQNLTPAYLMGDIADWVDLPAYQLHLPLSAATTREALLFTAVSGTR